MLVDGDNVPPEILGPMLARLERDGPVTERRIFRNWRSSRNAAAWDDASKRYAFERVDRYRTSVGKNASDIALVVTAMDLLHGGTRTFCIASGDTDFAPLVERLRRAGARVVLIGHKDDGGILTDVADEYLDFRNLERPAGAKAATGRSPQGPASRPAAPNRSAPSRDAAPRQGGRGPSRSAPRPAQAPTRSAQAGRPRKAPVNTAATAKVTARPSPGTATRPRGRTEPAAARTSTPKPASSPTPSPAKTNAGIDGLRNVLLDCYEVARTDGEVDEQGWVPVDRLGQIARSVDPAFSLGKYGVGNRASLSRVFERIGPPFEVEAVGRSGNRQYRVRRTD